MEDLDLSPLRSPAGLRQIALYERMLRIPLYRRLIVVLVAVVVFEAAMVVALWWMSGEGILRAAPVLAVFAVAYAVFAIVLLVSFALGLGRRVRIAWFAWANGFSYADSIDGERRDGSAFRRARRSRERAVVAVEDRASGLVFELGRHYSVGDRSQGATVQRPFAFAEIPLPAPVPQIVLANRRRSVIPTLGLGRGAARMELEGDFSRTFLLFVPDGYQADALYVFTPDLMARVLDLASGAEIELVGRSAYLYLPAGTRYDRAEVMEPLVGVVAELSARLHRRTARYRDDHVGAAARAQGIGVSLRGWRLPSSGISLLAVGAVVVVVLLSGAVTALSLFGAALGLFGG